MSTKADRWTETRAASIWAQEFCAEQRPRPGGQGHHKTRGLTIDKLSTRAGCGSFSTGSRNGCEGKGLSWRRWSGSQTRSGQCARIVRRVSIAFHVCVERKAYDKKGVVRPSRPSSFAPPRDTSNDGPGRRERGVVAQSGADNPAQPTARHKSLTTPNASSTHWCASPDSPSVPVAAFLSLRTLDALSSHTGRTVSPGGFRVLVLQEAPPALPAWKCYCTTPTSAGRVGKSADDPCLPVLPPGFEPRSERPCVSVLGDKQHGTDVTYR